MQQDSIAKAINDSLKLLREDSIAHADSIVRADSLARIDSIRVADSLRVAAHQNSGFPGVHHPSFAFTEYWVFPVLLMMFFFIVLAVSRSGSLIPETIKNYFQLKERSSIFSKATVNDFRIRLFIIIFSVMVFAFYAFYLLHEPGTPFSVLKFGSVLLITALFFWLKSLVFDLLGYVFMDAVSARMARDSYFNALSFVGIILFPIVIIRVYSPYNMDLLLDVTAMVVCVTGYVLIIFKLFQIFLTKFVATFYILLYLCTLEFLPLIAMFQVYRIVL